MGLLQVDIDIDGLLSFDPMTSSKFTIDGIRSRSGQKSQIFKSILLHKNYMLLTQNFYRI